MPFTFQRLLESFVLRRLSMSSARYISKTIRVFCFQDYQSLLACRDYQSHLLLYFSKITRVFCLAETINFIHLYFSKTIIVCCLAETINVICLYFSKNIRVFCLAETVNVICSLLFPGLSESFVKTIKVFFTFPRLSKLLSCRDVSR